MKKLTSLALVILLMVVSIPAWAVSIEDFNGKWEAESVVVYGLQLSASFYGLDMTAEINNGKVVLYPGTDSEDEGVFHLEGDALRLEEVATIEIEDDQTLKMTFDADEEGIYMLLKKVGEVEGGTPSTTPTATIEPKQYDLLEQGSKGDSVKALQEKLIELGYLYDSADGNFGAKTKSAVEAFQSDNELEANGVADQTTQEKLFSTKPDPYKISDSAKEVHTKGTENIIVTDWAYVEDDWHDSIVLALTNVSDSIIPELEAQIVFYDSEGNVIGMEKDRHDAILPGSTVITETMLLGEDVGDYASVEVTLDDSGTNNYENHADKLDIEGNVNGDNVFLQVTNTDTETIEEVEIAVVYYKDDLIVGADTEETFDLGVGSTYTLEFNGYKEYHANRYRYFVNQAHTFNIW